MLKSSPRRQLSLPYLLSSVLLSRPVCAWPAVGGACGMVPAQHAMIITAHQPL